jgi:hypothetical protein
MAPSLFEQGHVKMKHVIFIHNPKSAGSSILKVIKRDKTEGIKWHHFGHMPAFIIRRRTGPELFREAIRFCVVRNPYDRLVSAYSYLNGMAPGHRHWESDKNDALFIQSFSDFKDFVKNGIEDCRRRLHFPAQAYMVSMANEILRFENLDHDWSIFQEKIGMDQTELPIRNSSIHPPWEECYDESTKEIVHEFYEQDFEKFEYDR